VVVRSSLWEGAVGVLRGRPCKARAESESYSGGVVDKFDDEDAEQIRVRGGIPAIFDVGSSRKDIE
jgi:hypothetical protein